MCSSACISQLNFTHRHTNFRHKIFDVATDPYLTNQEMLELVGQTTREERGAQRDLQRVHFKSSPEY